MSGYHGGWHRKRWMAPATVGGTSNGGWHRKRWVAPATVTVTNNGGWHRQRWVAPATVGGTGKAIRTVSRIVEGTDWFSAGIAIAARLPSHCPRFGRFRRTQHSERHNHAGQPAMFTNSEQPK